MTQKQIETQEKINSIYKICLKVLHTLFLSASVALMFYTVKISKTMYDWVQVTTQTDQAQNSSIANHMIMITDVKDEVSNNAADIKEVKSQIRIILNFLKL